MNRNFVDNKENRTASSSGRRRRSHTTRSPSHVVASGSSPRHDRHTRSGTQQTHVEETGDGEDSEPSDSQVSAVFPSYLDPQPFVEVSRAAIEAVDPEQKDIPIGNILANLRSVGEELFSVIRTATPNIPGSTNIPTSCEVVVNDLKQVPPTHVVAVFFESRSTLVLYPVHALILVANCAKLPTFPYSKPEPVAQVGSTVTLPVVPLQVWDPTTFQMLFTYLYSHDRNYLISKLLPAVPDEGESIQDIADAFSQMFTANRFIHYATKVHGLWKNMIRLGVFDEDLWEIITWTWEVLSRALQATTQWSVMLQPQSQN